VPSATVETEVTEGTRPVHIPEEEFCERVMKPQPATCQVRHEVTVDTVQQQVSYTGQLTKAVSFGYQSLPSGGVRSGHQIRIPQLDALCLSTKLDIFKGITASVYEATIWEHWSWDGGYSIDRKTRSNPGARLITLSKPLCVDNLAVVQAVAVSTGDGNTYIYAFESVRISIKGLVEQLVITADRWYPEDCVARAQRDR